MTYRLYWAEGTAAFLPRVMLEAAGLPYELVPVDIAAGANRSPEFLALNPLGKVPALALPDGAILAETAAIALNLADTHGLEDLAPAPSDAARWSFVQWLVHYASTIQPIYKTWFYPERYAPGAEGAAAVKRQAAANIRARWQTVETALAKDGPLHLGDRASLIDIYLVMTASWTDPALDLLGQFGHVARCYVRTAAHPAVRAELARQTRITTGEK